MNLSMLKRRSEFVSVKSGASWGTPGFLLQAKPRTSQKNVASEQVDLAPRFGVTVTKNTIKRLLANPRYNKRVQASAALKPNTKPKPLKKAKAVKRANDLRGPVSVLRNKMRRRLKEALLLVGPEAAVAGVDYVIIGRDACLSLDFNILLKDLEKSFQKVHRRIIPTGKDQSE